MENKTIYTELRTFEYFEGMSWRNSCSFAPSSMNNHPTNAVWLRTSTNLHTTYAYFWKNHPVSGNMWASCISWQKSLRLMKSFGHLKVSCHGHYARFTNGYLIVRLAKTAETLQVKCTQNLCSQQNLQKAKNRKDWKKYCRHVTAAVSTIFCESCLAARGSFAKTGCLVSTSLVQHERIFGRKLMVGCDGRCDFFWENCTYRSPNQNVQT